MNIINKIGLGFYVLCISASVYAFNTDFLKYSSVYYFTDQDWKIMQMSADAALNGAKDGTKVKWQNRQSGAFGYLIPSKTQKNQGMTCRYLSMITTANHVSSNSTYYFCKV